ncbi:MAG: nucleotidyltransferase domain-containing protein [Lachnospiraceae bacterium]|nr:nucleotidyltransferase domain-containing protein [Lachnospiraceae bacterium]
MIYSIHDIQTKVKDVADQYDILEIRLFGSYFDHVPTEQSDVDLLVKYGNGCRGLRRIRFMNDLEAQLGKDVDVINIDFAPDFVSELDLNAEGRLIYAQ